MLPSVDEHDGSEQKQNSDRALPVPAAQIELPPSPSPAESLRLDVVDVVYNPSSASDSRLKQDSESWKAVCGEIDKYDQDMVKKWKDDLDMLLLFGGLFSVVVTSFTIESYQWLMEDPGEAAVALLSQISQQLRDSTATTLPDPNVFHPQPSLILINFFWFISLTLALTSGLFALLCEQWLREHMRETAAYTRTTAESLALRQLRRDSLEKWRVPQIIALTPILLQAALLLFFAGIVVLAWTLNLALFIVCFVICGLGAGFYFSTTLLPLLAELSADVRQKSGEALSFRFINPYKSPQAWAMYRFFCMMIRQLPLIGSFLAKRGYNWRMAVKPAQDWSFSDMRVLTAFDLNPPPLNLNVYELRALDWAARMLQHSSSMVPHLKNIFSSLSLHPSVIMAGILNYWTLAMWEEFTLEDVQNELEDTTKFQETKREGLGWYMTVSRAPGIPDPILHSKAGIQMLLFHQYWFNLIESDSGTITVQSVRDLNDSISHFREMGLPRAINLRFFVPFPIASKLWSHADPSVRQESLSLIEYYRDGWNAYPGPEEKGDERLAFIAALIKHLRQDYGGHRSVLFTNDQGTDFIYFVHNGIIQHRLYEPSYWESDGHHRSVLIREWVAAIHQYWFNLVEGDVGTITVQSVGALNDSISRFREMGLPKAINLCYFVPFPIASKLWSHADPSVRQESLSLIEYYRDGWNAYAGPEEKGDERLAFIAALIKHKQDYGEHRSILFTSDQGTDFIQFIHNGIIQHRLYERPYWESDGNHRSVLMREWVAATWSIAQTQKLPDIPEYPPSSEPPERSSPSKGPPRAQSPSVEEPSSPLEYPPYPHTTRDGDTFGIFNLHATYFGDSHAIHNGDIHGTYTTNGDTHDTCVTHGNTHGAYTTNGNTHDTYVTHGDTHSTHAIYGDTFNSYTSTTHGERCTHNRYVTDKLELTIVNNHWGLIDEMGGNDSANVARQEDAG